MAVSAYRGSQLKKNPLLGTALNVDPSRVGEKARFLALHKEAKGMVGQGREAMEQTLKRRFLQLGGPQVRALGSLGEEYGGLQQKAAELRDPEQEAQWGIDLTDAQARLRFVEGHEDPKYSGKSKSGKTLPKDYKKRFKKEVLKDLGKKEKKRYKKDPTGYLKGYYGQTVQDIKDQRSTYEAGISESLGLFEKQATPIRGEIARHEGVLSQYIQDYNRFLGVVN